MVSSKRIETLRAMALYPTVSCERMYLRFYRHLAEAQAGDALLLRYANAFAYALEGLPPCVDPGELIVGKANRPLDADERAEWAALQPLVSRTAVTCGQDSHMAVDYDKLLTRGITGIMDEISPLLETAPEQNRDFYRACLICLEAVARHAESYAAHLQMLAAAESDPGNRAELLALSAICSHVPRHPAGSFHEAVQSVHFLTHCLTFAPLRLHHQQFQLGRPDRYLWPFYHRDRERGGLTKERAQTLIDCLSIQINNRVPAGLSSGYMVGGRDRHGEIVQNELTAMFMETIERVHLVYPAVGWCYAEGMRDELLRRAVEILSGGCSHPALFNDDLIAQGLMDYGVNEAQAHEYVQSTCVEITPIKASNVWVASPYTNLPQLLLDILPQDPPDFDALVAAYLALLDSRIEANFEAENQSRKVRAERSCNPLVSCFVDDCLSRGVDIEQGGARYNWIMPSFVGMANLVDSLHAIRALVYERKQLSLKQLKAALDADFLGQEPLRQQIIHALPKYGNDEDDVDGLVGLISGHIADQCRKHVPLLPNARLIPSVFCWVMHERFGRETGATPDGRNAGFPLGDGSGPSQGREQKGPTASILSSTKWSHKAFIGGVAVNMKFSRRMMRAASGDLMIELIKTYMDLGGFELQINVVDAETLRAAQAHPEQYADLIVRIGGYSDYFVRLSTEMQMEVLQRTEHTL